MEIIGLDQEKRESECVHSTTQTANGYRRKFPRVGEGGPQEETKGQEEEIMESCHIGEETEKTKDQRIGCN